MKDNKTHATAKNVAHQSLLSSNSPKLMRMLEYISAQLDIGFYIGELILVQKVISWTQ